MLSFECDYNVGAHEKILKRLLETNMEKLPGYGEDVYCRQAKAKIQCACQNTDAEVHFLTGGTQTNQIVIDTMLAPYEGVVAAQTGHVNCHEAGAIEYTGHKVMGLPQKEGKISAEDLKKLAQDFYDDESHEHMVFPGMVYLSYPTEYGTLYSKPELEAIYDVCKEYQMTLFIDGARLGYGLMSKQSDLTLPELSRLCDVFYIGGTKVGALIGEAVVFTHKNTPKHFMNQVKKHGALLAKGRVLGIQFDTLFTDNLYFKISENAIAMAEALKEIFRKKEYQFYMDSPTNQIFIVLENQKMEGLRNEVRFSYWEKYDDIHTVVRFATSWATTQRDIEELERLL